MWFDAFNGHDFFSRKLSLVITATGVTILIGRTIKINAQKKLKHTYINNKTKMSLMCKDNHVSNAAVVV